MPKHAPQANPLCHLFSGEQNGYFIRFVYVSVAVLASTAAAAAVAAAERCMILMRIFQYFIWLLNENSSSYSLSLSLALFLAESHRNSVRCCFNCVLPSSVIHCVALFMAIKMDGN